MWISSLAGSLPRIICTAKFKLYHDFQGTFGLDNVGAAQYSTAIPYFSEYSPVFNEGQVRPWDASIYQSLNSRILGILLILSQLMYYILPATPCRLARTNMGAPLYKQYSNTQPLGYSSKVPFPNQITIAREKWDSTRGKTAADILGIPVTGICSIFRFKTVPRPNQSLIRT